SAACLASRFVYGETITREKLAMVEQGEEVLRDMGFRQLRVRMHGENLARIEVDPASLGKLVELGEPVTEAFREIGFTYVTMDLRGYRTGSMNEVLSKERR
ncbi:MAG: TIGR00268 family protein, partial [Eubacteriales bacterium]|nr:TIGR00268 family protein [Eubacteriales bacterium]